MAEMMGGAIGVESEYGKGSTFTVRLRQAFVSDAPIGKEVAENLTGLRYNLSKRDNGAKLIRADLSYAHVLVVDDIETNLDVVRGMMKPYGLKIDCATSGQQAITMIRSENPRYGAVFMDHMMPEMDGVETTRRIRTDIGTEYARNLPIIALTANALVGNEEMFLRNGFQDFISKPIDMAKLDAVLRRWVRDKTLEEKAADAGGAAPAAPGIAVEGLDTQKALERFGGDGEIFAEVLRSYAKNTRPLLAVLRSHLESGDLAAYAVVVHGVKGASYGIGADQAGKAAETLEAASKANDLAAVQAGHPALEGLLETLLNHLGKALGLDGADSDKPAAAAPDPEVLSALRTACAGFHMDAVDSAMAELEKFRYESGGPLVAWLREQVDGMAFEVISGGDWPEEDFAVL
jgi:CheY-like chemotaxis protein